MVGEKLAIYGVVIQKFRPLHTLILRTTEERATTVQTQNHGTLHKNTISLCGVRIVHSKVSYINGRVPVEKKGNVKEHFLECVYTSAPLHSLRKKD